MHVDLFSDGLSNGALLTFKTGPHCICAGLKDMVHHPKIWKKKSI